MIYVFYIVLFVAYNWFFNKSKPLNGGYMPDLMPAFRGLFSAIILLLAIVVTMIVRK